MTKTRKITCSTQLFEWSIDFRSMSNNVVIETIHATSINRPVATGDSETYQQCSYQTFQMLVLSVVDQSNSKWTRAVSTATTSLCPSRLADEVRLKHLQNISENIEVSTDGRLASSTSLAPD